ncbi:hypothetical protein [Nesterenkonia xinjiangensis]|uniref:Uncharacterized membrane protein YfbV (UPF0208 family) n=1 Tax=Nesterenkonia xinjiangensis TaxID=225327 RepID=A0A7Z0K9Q7_9MICC|nr:hypothetical protein [Nesterenkonia xinjiangensis]NYJ79009.1 uncharacterized membrane protein YfbV (UPF0208 family) [Nesterenkonia xinjiangensis]
MSGPTGQPSSSPNRGLRSRPVLMGICFTGGAVIGVLGTAVHGNLWMLGETHTGFVIPWGAVVALLLSLLGQLWAGLRADSLLEPTVMGITTFTVVTIAYLWTGPDQLMVPYSAEAMQLLPGPTLASLIWWLGSAGITLVSMVLVKWILARDKAVARAAARPGEGFLM